MSIISEEVNGQLYWFEEWSWGQGRPLHVRRAGLDAEGFDQWVVVERGSWVGRWHNDHADKHVSPPYPSLDAALVAYRMMKMVPA